MLCAGASSRLGEPKALARIGGRAVLERMLAAAHRAFPDGPPPLVVTGAHHDEITAFLALGGAGPLGFEVAFNPAWSDGRTAGLQLAARRYPDEDLLIWPADVPLVGAECLASLVQEWDRMNSPGRGWLAPSVGSDFHALDGKRKVRAPNDEPPPRFGHPVVAGRELLNELHALTPGSPLRTLRDGAEPLASLSVEDVAVLDDLDTPADLERLRGRVEQRGV